VIVREAPSPTRLRPAVAPVSRRRARRRPSAIVRPVVVVVLAVVTVGIPLWIALITSVKPQGEAQKPNLALPQHWQPGANYAQALNQGKLIQGLVNSLLVVLPSVALVLILGAAAAWVFARRKGKLDTAGYTLAVSGLLLPPAVITIVMELRQLGLANSTSIFFMTGFIRGTIPVEVEEAARIDGAGPVRIFCTILLPMLRPVIATATIMVMLYAWSDVFYAFFVLGGGNLATAPLNLYQVANASVYLNNWHLIFAYVVLMSLPMIAVFLLAQRRIIAGITGGAVK